MSFGSKNQDRRRWPVERFAALADKVAEKFNAKIVLIWGPGEEGLVKEIALKTHQAVGCYDISRTDIRLSKDRVPYVLEINPLPGLNPTESNFPIMAYAAGMKYEDIIESILMSASERKMS